MAAHAKDRGKKCHVQLVMDNNSGHKKKDVQGKVQLEKSGGWHAMLTVWFSSSSLWLLLHSDQNSKSFVWMKLTWINLSYTKLIDSWWKFKIRSKQLSNCVSSRHYIYLDLWSHWLMLAVAVRSKEGQIEVLLGTVRWPFDEFRLVKFIFRLLIKACQDNQRLNYWTVDSWDKKKNKKRISYCYINLSLESSDHAFEKKMSSACDPKII